MFYCQGGEANSIFWRSGAEDFCLLGPADVWAVETFLLDGLWSAPALKFRWPVGR
jgi:hypothetical protein|tara:strand:+ start:181 stop:345 length:165 start_codon:yes stop_codon:yes gene_type:complete